MFAPVLFLTMRLFYVQPSKPRYSPHLPRQKYIVGPVLGWTCKFHSDILSIPPLIFIEGA